MTGNEIIDKVMVKAAAARLEKKLGGKNVQVSSFYSEKMGGYHVFAIDPDEQKDAYEFVKTSYDTLIRVVKEISLDNPK